MGVAVVWTLMVTARRWSSQWRLLVAVTAVAVLACSLVTSLVLLVGATEQAGVRGALGDIPTEQSRIDVRVLNPRASIADARRSFAGAVGSVVGSSAGVDTSGFATSKVEEIDDDTFAYFGEYDGFESRATLTAGAWPAASSADGLQVAIPAAGADALHLGIGDRFAVGSDSTPAEVTIVGIYRPDDEADDYWSRDILGGRGDEPNFGRPGESFAPPVEAIGPLVAANGAADAADVPIATLDLQYLPSFDSVTVAQLARLRERVESSDIEIPTGAGQVGGQIFVSTRLGDAVDDVVAGLVVTRSTVVVVALLLGVLAVAATAQTARLFTDARAAERRLLRARGASAGRILALGLVEALVIGVVTAFLGPVVATLVYALLARQAPMVAAGMPPVVGATPSAWLTAAGAALALVLVLVAPLLTRSGELVDTERARPRRLGGFARSGLDIGIVVIAVVAFWQLRAYRSPVAASGSLSVDPVLAAGPAIALLACALVCVRLIPLAAQALQRLGQGGRGAMGALVGWEIGRRTRRATTTVLALSLALAVGSFALSFLATWRQSQVDQANVAVGAPVRIAAEPTSAFAQGASLATGGISSPAPAIHRLTRVLAFDTARGDASTGIPAGVLGLTASSRDLMKRGRLADVGGAVIARELSEPTPAAGIALGHGVESVSARVVVVAPDLPVGTARVIVSAIVESDTGLLGTVRLGEAAVDGKEHELTGAVATDPGTDEPLAAAGTLTLTGIRVALAGTDGDIGRMADAPARVSVTNIATVSAGVSSPVAVPDGLDWQPIAAGAADQRPTTLSGLAFDAVVPPGIRSEAAVFELVGWDPIDAVDVVIPAAFADDYALDTGARAVILVQGIAIPVWVTGEATRLPGSALLAELGTSASAVAVEPAPTLVVDETKLARVLVQEGFQGGAVDEWWADAAPGAGATAVRDHPGAVSAEVVATQLQQAPLRVAVQPTLWLALVAGGVLAAIGFAVQTAATVRERRLEFAQLQAIGLSRRGLTTIVALESALLVALGAVFGVGIGLALAAFVGPLVAVSPDGTPPVPSVIVEVPWLGIAVLVGVVAVVLVGIVAVVASAYRAARPGDLLRAGGE